MRGVRKRAQGLLPSLLLVSLLETAGTAYFHPLFLPWSGWITEHEQKELRLVSYIKVNTDTWSTSATSVNSGSTTNDDITNDVMSAINNLANDLGTISFLKNTQLLIAALDDFGNNMAGALACVGVDLQVVGSGLASAAAAYGANEQALKQMFANLNAEMGYYTSTATSVQLATPTASQIAALGALPTTSSAITNNPANWLNLSNTQPQPATSASTGAATAVGVLVVVCIIAICLA